MHETAGGNRRRRARAALVIITVVAALGAAIAPAALAAPPDFPSNILVFPDRDFVTVEGFQDHVGETGTVEVTRNGQVVGSARGVVEAGDVAFEINHPGGYCWGAGTGLAVTPDIKAGDVVSIAFGGAKVADTVVGDAAVDARPTLSGTTMTVTGHIGPGVNPTFLEQRIVNPDLTSTEIARRDIRAVPGPLTRAARGGYSSGLAVSGTTVTATYVFDNATTAQLAATGGGERMLSWQVQDPAGNRQGLTLAEFGEPGGPGMGGCPAGPGQQGAPRPGTAAVVRAADGTGAQVTWTPATPVPGAAAVTGYQVEAVGPATDGTSSIVGKRVPATAGNTTLTGLTATTAYTVEVRALTGTALSEPMTAPLPVSGSGGGTVPPPNATFDKPTATSTPGGITLTGAPAGAEIYYTTDGTDPRVADLPSATARLYTGPIVLTGTTTLQWVAFDATGAFSDTGTGTFGATVTAPGAVTGLSATAGDASAALRWTAPTAGATPTKYVITATPTGGGTAVVQEAPATATAATLTRLINGTAYAVTVAAWTNTVAGPPSNTVTVTPVAATTDRLSITRASWKSGDFRVDGTGTLVGATVTLFRVNADGSVGAAIPNSAVVVTAPVAPATLGDFRVRLTKTAAPATNPGRIVAQSDRGGQSAPFTVTAG